MSKECYESPTLPDVVVTFEDGQRGITHLKIVLSPELGTEYKKAGTIHGCRDCGVLLKKFETTTVSANKSKDLNTRASALTTFRQYIEHAKTHYPESPAEQQLAVFVME